MKRQSWLFSSLLVLCLGPQAFAGTYVIDPDLSEITGAIRYTVIGKYVAKFRDYKGELVFDPNRLETCSVFLRIKNRSIRSSYETLDNIVRSKKILDVARFPDTIFQGKSFRKGEKENQFIVDGDLTLHGVTRRMSFVFDVQIWPGDPRIKARGSWVVNRKDFGIVWDRLLDKSGVLVGNHFTVDWKITGWEKPVKPAGKNGI